MIDSLHAALGIGGLLLACARVGQLRADLTSRSLWIALTALSIAQCIEVWAVYHLVGRVTGYPTAGFLLMSGLVVLGSTASRQFTYTLRPDRTGTLGTTRVAAPGLLVFATICVANTLHHPAAPAALHHLPIYYDSSVYDAIEWDSSMLYLAWALLLLYRANSGYSRLAPRGPVRTGLALGAAGVAVGFGFVVLKLVVVSMWLAGDGPRTVATDRALEAGILLVCLVLIGVGSAYAAITLHWQAARQSVQDKARRRRHDRQGLADLQPLADLLRQWAPSQALELPAAGDRLRLTLLTTAIRDRQRHLQQFPPSALVETASRIARDTGYPLAAAHTVGEAVSLRVGAALKTAGAPPVASGNAGDLAGAELEQEVLALRALARALTSDPFVAQLADIIYTDLTRSARCAATQPRTEAS